MGFTRKDPHKYKGSGIRWLSHLRKHGCDIETEILHETADLDKIQQLGEYYSKLWNVVQSSDWANLKPESVTNEKPVFSGANLNWVLRVIPGSTATLRAAPFEHALKFTARLG